MGVNFNSHFGPLLARRGAGAEQARSRRGIVLGGGSALKAVWVASRWLRRGLGQPKNGLFFKANRLENPAIWALRLRGFGEVKNSTLKSQILEGICSKMCYKIIVKTTVAKSAFYQIS